jgi:hypothetical protein
VERAAILACALVAARAMPASADGAFPDSQQILLPADRPHAILLGTNFGMLFSEDDGATFRWACEQAIAPLPSLFQVGAPPGDRLFAIATTGLAVSQNGGCDWQIAQFADGGNHPLDVFPDPSDEKRSLATARTGGNGASGMALFVSTDGGLTYQTLWAAPDGITLTGVEISRSSPSIVYLTAIVPAGAAPARLFLFESSDGGKSFLGIDETAALPGIESLRLAAIDPAMPETIYLLAQGPRYDALAITDDAGATIRIAQALDTRASAFLRRENGDLLVGTGAADLFESHDHGHTFSRWPKAPHLRALGERGDTLYLVADTFLDSDALYATTDDGATQTPIFRYSEICAPLSCATIANTCATPWAALSVAIPIAPAPACYGRDGGAQPFDLASQPPVTVPPGCSCAVGARGSSPIAGFAIALLVLLSRIGSRSRRRPDDTRSPDRSRSRSGSRDRCRGSRSAGPRRASAG